MSFTLDNLHFFERSSNLRVLQGDQIGRGTLNDAEQQT